MSATALFFYRTVRAFSTLPRESLYILSHSSFRCSISSIHFSSTYSMSFRTHECTHIRERDHLLTDLPSLATQQRRDLIEVSLLLSRWYRFRFSVLLGTTGMCIQCTLLSKVCARIFWRISSGSDRKVVGALVSCS
jgi:hypothetical protein